jgi:tetratricopeptide (TPR) repeat protein
MKNVLVLFFTALISLSILADNHVVDSFINEKVQEAKKSNKLPVLEFWAPSCGPCVRLKREIFENDLYKEFLNMRFFIVPISPSDSLYNPLWKSYRLVYQSTIVYLDKSGDEIDRTVSYDGNKDAYISFMNNVSEGKNLFRDILQTYKADTNNVPALFALAKKLTMRYELKGANNYFTKVLLLDPSNNNGLNCESRFRIAENELMLSGNLNKMNIFIKSDSDKLFIPKAYEYLLNNFIGKKEKQACLDLSIEAYQKYPDSWEILNKYAWAICTFRLKDKYPQALTMGVKSITLNPERAGTYSTVAWVYYLMGNQRKAIEYQKKAIERSPNTSYTVDLELFMNNKGAQ